MIGNEKDYKQLKNYLDSKGLISQFMQSRTAKKLQGKGGPMSNILRQVNAKVDLDLFQLELP